MSGAAAALQAAFVEALGTVSGLSGVYDGPPARAQYPYAAIGSLVSGDWSHKSGRGREHRLIVTLWDDGLSPALLHDRMAAAEAAIEAMPEALEGHRLASIAFVRSRVVRDADGPWAGIIEYRARTLEN